MPIACQEKPKSSGPNRRTAVVADCQKWKMRSLAAIAAQLREGSIPALALPLNAFAFSER